MANTKRATVKKRLAGKVFEVEYHLVALGRVLVKAHSADKAQAFVEEILAIEDLAAHVVQRELTMTRVHEWTRRVPAGGGYDATSLETTRY